VLMQIPFPDGREAHIPGLTFRAFRGEIDFPVMVNIMNACNRADQAEYNESVEDVAHVFSRLTNCDPASYMLFADVEGQPVGYSRVFWKDEYCGPRTYIHLGFVVPSFRRLGLGRTMLQWNERRLAKIAATHSQDLEKVFHAWATDASPGAIALLESQGYRRARTMLGMTRSATLPLPECSGVGGIMIRPGRAVESRVVWDAWEEGYRDHWGYAPRAEEQYVAWTKSRLFQPHLWKIAWDGDRVAGMVLNYIDTRRNDWAGIQRGYTQDIFVLRPWRRRGLARKLLTESIRMFVDMGMEETLLGVDSENPYGARKLYESLGYRASRRHYVYRKPLGRSL